MTHTALAELLAADLSSLDLVCLMIDGVHFGEHCCVVALGIAIDGTKHPLALVEGSTENATLARDLLVGLRERGLEVTRPILCVIDDAKAPRDPGRLRPPRDRQMPAAQAQKRLRQAPERLGGPVERRMRTAYHAASALDAEAQLSTLARELDKPHPGAAASLREGLTETLTVLRLGVPPTLARTLRSANPIESMISICRDHAGNARALAGRHHGAALVRRGDGRGHQAVPPRQRLPAPAGPAGGAGGRGRQDCHRSVRGSGGGGSGLMITGAATEVPRNSGHPRLGRFSRLFADLGFGDDDAWQAAVL
jgi:Transposase, Mutator family